MFTNKAFNITFLISLVWHLFCMSFINIVVLPGRYKTRELTSVSFLGPILERTALEIMLINKPVGVTTRYQYSSKSPYSLDRKEKLPLENETKDEAKKYISTHSEDNMGKVPGTILQSDKEVPNPSITKETRAKDAYKGLNEISGPVAAREVIFKPSKPELPSWITAGVPFTLELEFSVSTQGEIKKIVPVVSSGNPEVDLLGIRYLKGWKFAPLTHGLQRDESGRIKFIFGTEDKNL